MKNDKLNKNEKIFQAINNIDDNMIYNAVNDVPVKKKPVWFKWASMAAVLALVVVGAAAANQFTANSQVAAVIALDVNPSIEIEVNRNEQVMAVHPLNKDAEIVIGDMNLKKVDLDVAVNALVGSMLKNGYLSVDQNSIMVSVDSGDANKAAALQKQVSDSIATLMDENKINASLITQTYDKAADNKQAATNGISAAKSALISKVLNSNLADAKGNPYSYERLAAMSVNELKNILESKHVRVNGITSSGTASNQAYIGEDAAFASAYTHAGVNKNAVTAKKCEMDFDDGVMLYELEFYVNAAEYDYEINAVTGAIIDFERDMHNDYGKNNAVNNKPVNQNVSQVKADNTPAKQNNGPAKVDNTPAKPNNTSDNYIGKAAANAIAYKAAGVDAASVFDASCELDMERGKAVYEVEFDTKAYEYQYEIDAVTGNIIEYEKEVNDRD